MTLVKWHPHRNLLDMSSDFNRYFGNFFNEDVLFNEPVNTMRLGVDVEETDNEFKVSAELPGMNKDDIKITFQENVLTISGEKKAEKKDENKNYFYAERSYGKFCRSIGINSGVVLDKILADYKDGVLNITIPKAEEAKPKEIEVKVK